MASLLVTDGEQRAALAAVRSLGKVGHAVHVCSPRPRSLAGASRYAAAHYQVPDALRQPAAFVEAIEQLVLRHGLDLILPIAEPALLALLPARERLAAQIPFPAAERFRRIADKELVLETAASLGIGVPAQQVLRTPAEREAVLGSALPFPLVLKPARSVGEEEGTRYKLEVRHVADARALETELAAMPAAAYPLLVQQRIVGPGIGIFLLLWEGEVLAAFSHRRIREKPPSGGVSVYRESIPTDPQLLLRSRALLERLGWSGVAMVEYKVEQRTGIPYLMEINGRFWGSLQLAIDAGVDFPALLVAAALGQRPPPVTRYRSGVRSRWWWGDVDHLLARLRRSREALALPPESPGPLAALRDFLKLWRPGDRNEVLRWSDPRPAWQETIDWLLRR